MLYNCHGMQGNQWWKYNVVSTLYRAVCYIVQLSRHAGQPVVEVQRCEYFVPLCVILYNCHGMQGNQWWKYNVVSTLYLSLIHI